MTGWTLATVPPNREFVIAAALTRWCFENVVFKIRTRVCYRGRLLDRLRPAFPRYCFVKPHGQFHTLRTRVAGLDFVRDDGEVASVPDPIINSLLEAADDQHVIPTPDIVSNKFKQGDRLIIRGTSAMNGYAAIYQHPIDEFRALVLINWLGHPCKCGIDERDLERMVEKNSSNAPRRKRRRRRRDRQRGFDAPA